MIGFRSGPTKQVRGHAHASVSCIQGQRLQNTRIAKFPAGSQEEEESGKVTISRHWAQLKPGQQIIAQHVLTRRWDQHAVTLESRANGRSYVIRINGQSSLWNRRFLRPNQEPNQTNFMRPPTPQEATFMRPRHHKKLLQNPRYGKNPKNQGEPTPRESEAKEEESSKLN